MSELAAWLKEITPGGVGIWTAVALILVALIRQGPINRKLANEREGNLLGERAKDMGRMRRRIAELEEEQRVDRHAIANLEQCLDALLLFIEVSPDKAKEAAAKVRDMRAQMKEDLAKEKAGLHEARVTNAAQEEKDESV